MAKESVQDKQDAKDAKATWDAKDVKDAKTAKAADEASGKPLTIHDGKVYRYPAKAVTIDNQGQSA